MSLIRRLRHHIPTGIYRKPLFSPVIEFDHFKLTGSTRNFGQAAMKEEEVEEVEIDQRRLPTEYDPATFDPTEHRSPPTERVWRLVDEISALTLAETAELCRILLKKKNMKEPPVVGVMKPGSTGLAMAVKSVDTKEEKKVDTKEEKKVEKTAFDMKLESYEATSKIKIIKEVRSFTDLGLKVAKDLVEKAPIVFKKGVTKEEGEQIMEKMKALGAKVVME